MHPYPKALHGIVSGMIALWAFLLFPATSISQNEGRTARVLQVGVIAASPLYIKTPDGRWEGFSVELWQAVAQHLNVAI
jgi:ABC-type amino acid transport substrate-binding protein